MLKCLAWIATLILDMWSNLKEEIEPTKFIWTRRKKSQFDLPQFSIAPAEKSGIAIISIFGRGYFTLNVFSKNFSTFGPTNFAYSTYEYLNCRTCKKDYSIRSALTCSIASRLAHILNTTSPSAGDSLNSKSFIVYATRYVDIGTVTSNLSSTQSDLFALKIINNALKSFD